LVKNDVDVFATFLNPIVQSKKVFTPLFVCAADRFISPPEAIVRSPLQSIVLPLIVLIFVPDTSDACFASSADLIAPDIDPRVNI